MKMFKPKFLINLEKCILWQYDKAPKLSGLITEKQKWYKQNVSEFIVNFFINIFNLKTANDFGLNIWGKLLNFPRQIMLNKYQLSISGSSVLEDLEIDRLTFQSQIATGDDCPAITVGQGDKYTFVFGLSSALWYLTVYDKNNNVISSERIGGNRGVTAYGISFSNSSLPSSGIQITVVADYTPLNLSTEQYRFLLLGQVLKFKMSCTIPEVNRYLRLIFNEPNNDNVYVVDNHNMTISYNLEPPSLSDEIKLLIENYDFLPAPAGVKVNTGLGNYFDIEIVPSPTNANVVFHIDGQDYTSENNTLTVNTGTEVGYTVSSIANGFETKTGTVTVTENISLPVTLETTLTITAVPNTATITLILNGTEYTGTGSITKTVTYGNIYSYVVSNNGYYNEIGNGTITELTNINVELGSSVLVDMYFEGTNKIDGGVETKRELLLNTAGTYKIELGGDNSYGVYGEVNPYKTNAKGGTALLQADFQQGDILTIKVMYGGCHTSNKIYGGVGVGVWLTRNNVETCILVAGGAGVYMQSSGRGGGGYIGGKADGQNYYGGYSADGTRGNSTSMDSGAGERMLLNSGIYGYGGSGYVDSNYSSSATLVYAGNNTGKGYAKITYIETV